MPLSISNCFVAYYEANNSRLRYICRPHLMPATETFSDLGVKRLLNCQYHELISSVAQKGRRMVEMCIKNLQSRQPEFLLRVYTTYILLSLMYASQLWSPNLRYVNKVLDSVKRKFTKRLITGRRKRCGERLHQFDLLSLELRRSEQDV